MEELLRNLLTYSAWANAVFFHAWGKSAAAGETRSTLGVKFVLLCVADLR